MRSQDFDYFRNGLQKTPELHIQGKYTGRRRTINPCKTN
jgi:hypothetical protein